MQTGVSAATDSNPNVQTRVPGVAQAKGRSGVRFGNVEFMETDDRVEVPDPPVSAPLARGVPGHQPALHRPAVPPVLASVAASTEPKTRPPPPPVPQVPHFDLTLNDDSDTGMQTASSSGEEDPLDEDEAASRKLQWERIVPCEPGSLPETVPPVQPAPEEPVSKAPEDYFIKPRQHQDGYV